jgi:carboxyl-terminal processing protease
MTGSDVELGVFKLTIQQFFRVTGASTQREGVTPDVLLPDPLGHIESGERELEHAIPWSKIDPVKHDVWGGGWKTAELAARSATRVAATRCSPRSSPARSSCAPGATTPTCRCRAPAGRIGATGTRPRSRRSSPEIDKAPPRLTVDLLDESTAALAPGPGGKVDDRPAKWRDRVARDPWIEEAVFVLGDMQKAK